MSGTLDAAMIFGFLSFLHFWGGAAIGAGIAGRRVPPILWGLLIGATPLYFGIERGLALREWGWLIWQLAVLVVSALLVATRLPRLRAAFLTRGMNTLIVGTFLMAVGGVLGAWFFRQGSEFLSLLAGGIAFLFGSIWFGAGIKQLRGK
ncbi:MAG: hypothetical protein MUC34_05465 [Anaerolineae bacterium]|jgi:hypothetical protein|nr:hypothetical protein [Anaerolineae bacterium]